MCNAQACRILAASQASCLGCRYLSGPLGHHYRTFLSMVVIMRNDQREKIFGLLDKINWLAKNFPDNPKSKLEKVFLELEVKKIKLSLEMIKEGTVSRQMVDDILSGIKDKE